MDDGETVTGIKRNRLLEKVKGSFISFIDDDDDIAYDYIPLIYQVIAKDNPPDAVGFIVDFIASDKFQNQWQITANPKLIANPTMWERQGYVNAACHLIVHIACHWMCIKKELALQAKFPEVKRGEDVEYSKRVWPLIKTEEFLDYNLYEYHFVDLEKRAQYWAEKKKDEYKRIGVGNPTRFRNGHATESIGFAHSTRLAPNDFSR